MQILHFDRFNKKQKPTIVTVYMYMLVGVEPFYE